MKKLLCILLTLAMCLSAASAQEALVLSENSPFFDLTFDLPEGYVLAHELSGETTTGQIVPADGADERVSYHFSISFSDLYTGVSLVDMSEAELEELFVILSVPDESGEDHTKYVLTRFEDGQKAMIIYNDQAPYVCWALTLVDGYILQTYGMYPDSRPVTDADVRFGAELLDRMHITAVE